MLFELFLLYAYRAMALVIAVMMVWTLFRERDWQQQFFAMLVFIILHIYLLTTGHSFAEHVRPMVTGYDEIELSDVEEAYLRQDEPGRLRR